MIFTYETQGAITYLVCELEPSEQVDTLTLGMLTNNHIVGLAPVLYTEMNGQRYFKYNISAKLTSEQFFGGNVNKQRTLTAFQNILNAICSADEYMIDPNCFSVKPEHVFLNVSSCEAALLCVPIVSDCDINKDVSNLFKNILMSAQFDPSEDASYITELITYINNPEGFSVYGIRDLVVRLQSGVTSPASVSAPQAYGVQQSAPVSGVAQPSVPVSSFDATITMDDMAGAISPIPHPPVQQASVVPQAPVTPMQRPAAVPPAPPVAMATPQPSVTTAPKPPAVPPSIPVPPSPVKAQQPQASAQQPQAPLIPGAARPITLSAGNVMAIPGVNRASSGFAIPGAPNAQDAAGNQATQAPQQPSAEEGEKKMSIFGLLAHYNKDNVELYKKQKAEAKAKKESEAPEVIDKKAEKKAKKKSKKSDNAPEMETISSIPSHMIPGNTPVQQQFAQASAQPSIQPVPVQNSFNETTVLSPMMAGGETTVLGAVEPSIPQPCLIRIKTGERISINKPVFRIGKEKSYVDYFIADNIAISRSHANIHSENGEYFIEDTNSTNHTYVNGKVITSNVKTKIISGDKVKLANEDFTFLI